ncbi:MAG TPA: sigma-70 family RNA polymerase sigma factor [Intrasporangium sp.]|uniref:sigma-70 family RNA polymerase sigma factor n=1 Tax=Intrasporangium sp. TaxID=1925024 RepID=UPI002D770CDB|nr:sigma-70 family RNA polymerase sigma factor [Intrasporangium sp.]HET7398203.1 sigma-70 family RNA polymerase sigma factor [Intrasporangium sp.]
MALDEDAVAQIYLEHAPMLRRVVWRATGDAGRVEDIVQETILRVWRKAPDTDNLRAYLIATARHLIVDQHRAAARRPHEVALQDTGVGGTSDLDQALDQVLVEEALARLQPDHRTIIRCLYYERLTVVESARRLGIPDGTVKSRAFYAVRSLRDILDEMGVTR